MKDCPKCRRCITPSQTLCDCGYVIGDTMVTQDTAASVFADPRPQKRVKKAAVAGALIVAALVILGSWAVFYAFRGSGIFSRDTSRIEEGSPGRFATSLPANSFKAKVIGVRAGDLLYVRDEQGRTFQVRLALVSSPTLNEPFGSEARESLSARALDREVLVVPRRMDDGILVGEVVHDGMNLGVMQLQNGFASYARNSPIAQSDDQSRIFANAETAARADKYGIWSRPAFLVPEDALIPSETPEDPTVGAATSPSVRGFFGKPGPDTRPHAKGEAAHPSSPICPIMSPTPSRTATALAELSQGPKESDPKPDPDTPPAASVNLNDARASPVPANPTRSYTLGPRGGCFYLNSKGRKSYVDRSMCNSRVAM